MKRLLFVLLFLNSASLFASDTLCREKMIDKMICHCFTYIIFDYTDSVQILHHYIQASPVLYDQITHNLKIDYPECRQKLSAALKKGGSLSFLDFGRLTGYDKTPKKLVRKWMRKGRDKFLKYYFYNDKFEPQFYTGNPNFMYVFALAYQLGIVIEKDDNETADTIRYISDCDR